MGRAARVRFPSFCCKSCMGAAFRSLSCESAGSHGEVGGGDVLGAGEGGPAWQAGYDCGRPGWYGAQDIDVQLVAGHRAPAHTTAMLSVRRRLPRACLTDPGDLVRQGAAYGTYAGAE